MVCPISVQAQSLLVFVSAALTFYPLILKSQPRNHLQQSLACEEQTPEKDKKMSDKFKYQFGNFSLFHYFQPETFLSSIANYRLIFGQLVGTSVHI